MTGWQLPDLKWKGLIPTHGVVSFLHNSHSLYWTNLFGKWIYKIRLHQLLWPLSAAFDMKHKIPPNTYHNSPIQCFTLVSTTKGVNIFEDLYYNWCHQPRPNGGGGVTRVKGIIFCAKEMYQLWEGLFVQVKFSWEYCIGWCIFVIQTLDYFYVFCIRMSSRAPGGQVPWTISIGNLHAAISPVQPLMSNLGTKLTSSKNILSGLKWTTFTKEKSGTKTEFIIKSYVIHYL